MDFREKKREKELNMLTTKSFCFALVLALVLTLAAAGAVGAQPPLPHQFWGEVTINGSPAPDGTTVSAHIGSLSWSTTTSGGSYGYTPTFVIDGDDPVTPEKDGGIEGEVIVFKVNGMLAANYFFQAGRFTELDLAVQTYTLTIAVSGSGSTNPAVGVHTYALGTVVAITATPDAGWVFDSWSGDVAEPGSPTTTVTVDSDRTVTANFAEVPPTPVGGSGCPPNKLAVLAPWIGLGVVLAGSMTWLVLRRLRLDG